MPPLELPQEELEHPNFETDPVYQPTFQALVAAGNDRDQVLRLLFDLWSRSTHNDAPQQQEAPQLDHAQHNPGDHAQQEGHAEQGLREQRELPPHPHNFYQPQPPQRHGDQEAHHVPVAVPRAPLPTLDDNENELAPDKMDKRTPQLPPLVRGAKSLTMSLTRPSTYALERLRKFEYVPLWYFTEAGCKAADKDKAASEDVWDVTKTSDNRLALRTATSNRPSSNAMSDELLTWDQFIDGNHLLCRWLIPTGWPEDYAKTLTTFFWQIENHEHKNIPRGKETLLLYQARTRKAWHDELRSGHFFDLAELDQIKMNSYRIEVDAIQNEAIHKAVSHQKLSATQNNHLISTLFTLTPLLVIKQLPLFPTAASSCVLDDRRAV